MKVCIEIQIFYVYIIDRCSDNLKIYWLIYGIGTILNAFYSDVATIG